MKLLIALGWTVLALNVHIAKPVINFFSFIRIVFKRIKAEPYDVNVNSAADGLRWLMMRF